MKRYLLITTLVWLSLLAQAQQPKYGKMSGYVRQAAAEIDCRQSRARGAIAKEQHMMAFIKITDGHTDEILSHYGCQKHAQWGDIAIAEIPLSNLRTLAAEPAVKRIEASQSASLLMDTTVNIVNALPVYQPSGKYQAFTGEGVVVGIVDVGFDLSHPNFYNTSYSQYRIGAFWDQLSKDTIDSRVPIGRDYVGYEAVRAAEHSTDAATLTHGTHTLGIAAGSGHDTCYRGIAYDSDICLVANAIGDNVEYIDSADYYKYTTATDALAYKYCFDYASSQGKPCVVSLSEGYMPYLNEEDSLYAAVIDSLTGPGRIFVASAGNGGIEASYFEKTADQAEAGAFIRCFRENAIYKVKTEGAIRLSLFLYANGKGEPSDTLCYETADTPIDTVLSKQLLCGKDTLSLLVYRDRSHFDNDDIWQILVTCNRTLDQMTPAALVIGGECRAEVFGSSTSAFKSHESDWRWTAAQKGHDIYAPGCFLPTICVGATAHRLKIRNKEGKLITGSSANTQAGTVWEYSSTGPTMDGLMKPDVVAPGTNIVSSFNHLFYHEEQTVATSELDGKLYPWGAASGTSMSAPAVAGIIALWLQAKPDLTPTDIKEVFSRCCRQPEPGLSYPNNFYGYGEIDAYQGLLDILGLTGIEEISLQEPAGVEITPTKDGLRLVFDQTPKGPFNIKIFNLSGICVYQERLAIDSPVAHVVIPAPISGICIVQIERTDKQAKGSKLVKRL